MYSIAKMRRISLLRQRVPALYVSLGCELTLSTDNLIVASGDPSNFVIAGTRYVLVELNELLLPRQNDEGIHELVSLGLIPVIAHPERSFYFRRHLPLLAEWISIGSFAAITANSLTGFCGSEVRSLADQLLKRNLVHCIVSDGRSRKATPLAFRRHCSRNRMVGAERAHRMVFENPDSFVRGQPFQSMTNHSA
jgi:protein-tyrosine phosphatase